MKSEDDCCGYPLNIMVSGYRMKDYIRKENEYKSDSILDGKVGEPLMKSIFDQGFQIASKEEECLYWLMK